VLAGRVDGALADRLGVASWHAEPVATEGLAQRRPRGPQLGGGGVDAAELFGQRVGAFGFGPVDEEAAGLPAQVALLGRRQSIVYNFRICRNSGLAAGEAIEERTAP
jgi:hypothetical protein